MKLLLELKAEGDDPPALRGRVTLKRGLRKYRDMFMDLSSQREFNPAGVQSVPISEITAYLDGMCENRPQHRRLAIKLMLAMDSVFMAHVRKKQEQNRPSK